MVLTCFEDEKHHSTAGDNYSLEASLLVVRVGFDSLVLMLPRMCSAAFWLQQHPVPWVFHPSDSKMYFRGCYLPI